VSKDLYNMLQCSVHTQSHIQNSNKNSNKITLLKTVTMICANKIITNIILLTLNPNIHNNEQSKAEISVNWQLQESDKHGLTILSCVTNISIEQSSVWTPDDSALSGM